MRSSAKASPIGLVVIVLLFLATILLIRSMNKQLRKVPASFDEPDATPSDPTTPDVTAPPSATPPSGDEPGNAPIRS